MKNSDLLLHSHSSSSKMSVNGADNEDEWRILIFFSIQAHLLIHSHSSLKMMSENGEEDENLNVWHNTRVQPEWRRR